MTEQHFARIIEAWLQDRREQYTDDSATQVAIDDLIDGLRNSEPFKAHAHGELDGLIPIATADVPAELTGLASHPLNACWKTLATKLVAALPDEVPDELREKPANYTLRISLVRRER